MLWRSVFALAAPGGRHARLPILIFHRVRPSVDPLFPNEPDAQRFAALLAHLAGRFRVVALAEGVRRLFEGTLPARSLALSFDDGYADNLNVAAPLLAAAGMTATVFVATAFLDGGIMWNDEVIEALRGTRAQRLDLTDAGLGIVATESLAARQAAIGSALAALKHLSPKERAERTRQIVRTAGVAAPRNLMLTSEQVVALARQGFGIGAHTQSHPILTRLTPERAREEIVVGRARLEALIDAPVTLFAYPNGRPHDDYAPEHVRIVREAGFAAAVSTAWGTASPASDRFQLPRFTPWSRAPLRFDLMMLRNLRRDGERVAA